MSAPKDRRAWVFPLLVTVLVAVIGVWGDGVVRRAVEERMVAEMETVLGANVTALEIWMRNQRRLAEGIAEDRAVQEAAVALLTNSVARSREAAFEFEQVARPRMNTAGYMVAQLVSTNLQVIAGPGSGAGRGPVRTIQTVPQEHQAKFQELFAKEQAVIITPFEPGRGPGRRLGGPQGGPPGPDSGGRPAGWRMRRGGGDPGASRSPGPGGGRPQEGGGGPPARPEGGMMQVAAPIRDQDGTVRGAVAFVLNPELEFSRILSVARPGTTGETYAFDGDGLMLSRSRFEPQLRELGLLPGGEGGSSALTLVLRDPGRDLTTGGTRPATNTTAALIPMVADAVQGGGGVQAKPVRDYRGVPVVGAWRWLPEHHFGVATQQDASEAYRVLQVLRGVFMALTGLLALFAGGTVVASHLTQTWRQKASEVESQLKSLGQYTLEEKIGEGGMGVVYRARHALLRRETAVKLVLPERADDETLRQFEQEVRLTCGLTHPNTIQIYDFGRTPEGVFYYAMEFLHGLNLADLVASHGPQPAARVLYILAQVCDSLQEAHSAGLVHRDIKPANIILCERGGIPDAVKVLDFGLVRRFAEIDASPMPVGAGKRLSGTPNYLPPETIRDPGRCDPRGDLYALGAVGYFLATGQPVFSGDGVEGILERHLADAPETPRSRGANISAELEGVLLKCLAKEADARPASAAALRELLEACPEAGAWTVERRREWWQAHAASGERPQPTTASETADTVAATLHIDFAERTR